MTDLVYRLRKRAEIRRQIPTRKSVQEGQPDRIADLLEEAADALEKRDWENVTDHALIEEVRRRGFTIRDAQIEVNSKDWNEIQCQCGHKMFVKHTGHEWVGLTDEEIDGWNIVGHESLREFVRAIEAKLKERNT